MKYRRYRAVVILEYLMMVVFEKNLRTATLPSFSEEKAPCK